MSMFEIPRARRDDALVIGRPNWARVTSGVGPSSRFLSDRLRHTVRPSQTIPPREEPINQVRSLDEKLYDALASFKITTANNCDASRPTVSRSLICAA